MGILSRSVYGARMESRLDKSTIERVAVEAGVATAIATIRWAVEAMPGRLCLLASMQDALLIDLTMRVDRSIPVVFIDTGYHFPETHDTVRAIEDRYEISVEVVGPDGPVDPDVEPGMCCASKVDLLGRALQHRSGWITGISRVQTEHRRDAALVDLDRRGKIKVSPLAQWDQRDRDRYIAHHDLIVHPLVAAGYASIGCEPCTTRTEGSDVRSGRWAGSTKTECGLHL